MTNKQTTFKGYKATFTNAAGKSFPCFVVNKGSSVDKETREKIPALKIQINLAIGQTDFGRVIRKYQPAKWVRATSVR